MTDPDTPTSLTDDTPSGQEGATERYGSGPAPGTADTPSDTDPAPDPRSVKASGDDSPAAKDDDAWVTGDEPMTGPQASYLGTLAQQAGVEPPTGLTKAQASRAIDELRAKAGRAR